MAEVDYDAYDSGTYETGPDNRNGLTSAIVNWSGALLSVGLVGGLGVWGYQLSVRDVSEIPVIQALAGPMRMAPKDPGGSRAAHQGLSVNQVQAEGQAAPVADRVVLAPEPLELPAEAQDDVAEEPVALAALESAVDADTVATSRAARSPAADALPAAAALDARGAVPGEAEEGLSRILPARAVPQKSTLGAAVDAVVQAVARPQADAGAPVGEATLQTASFRAIPADIPGVARSVRPARRSSVDVDSLLKQRNARPVAAAAPARSLELDADSLTPGTRLVQLGAYDSVETARVEWDRISARFATYMDGRQRVIQKTESGGRTFYRLRVAGFDGVSDSRRFCSVLLAENAACIPVVAR
ncbi:hypothetical protein BV394_01045 [Brevirhabdus pacifica]|uniref:Uncharacterized protein n=2 Tax=Brevirhabdus pacifica TaxID=1267768 RepID=A0A1U7DEQ9_9RHOB|nr:SPOR domain-containing protein [Brevirhabdus pacifica]APX88487.1 hypothetical protein BV394_01045 [Brevirhabdus pacifica]OWU79791.1 hypothetical protein ATO5_01745 [Loktanella sp. 22II-4b]PJJ87037.1 sporulation related protein [Brevirhabdus pacifica]